MDLKNNFIKYVNLINSITNDTDFKVVEELFKEMTNCFESRGRIFLAGNGGSAAIANHASADLAKLSKNGNYLNVISLTTNIPQLTANSNDDGYENALTLNLRNFYINNKDIIITISSSGNSKNIINLIEYATKNKAKSYSLLGFDGGSAKNTEGNFIVFNSKNGYYGPIEDIHMMLFHYFAHTIKKDISELNE